MDRELAIADPSPDGGLVNVEVDGRLLDGHQPSRPRCVDTGDGFIPCSGNGIIGRACGIERHAARVRMESHWRPDVLTATAELLRDPAQGARAAARDSS